jgi:hypothetical protein
MLAFCLWMRPEIPRHHLLRLLSESSEAVKQQFQVADPRKMERVTGLIHHVASMMQAETRKRSPEFIAARARVQAMYDADELDQRQLEAFAIAGKFDESSIALALICDLPIGVVERALVEQKCDQILLLGKPPACRGTRPVRS